MYIKIKVLSTYITSTFNILHDVHLKKTNVHLNVHSMYIRKRIMCTINVPYCALNIHLKKSNVHSRKQSNVLFIVHFKHIMCTLNVHRVGDIVM